MPHAHACPQFILVIVFSGLVFNGSGAFCQETKTGAKKSPVKESNYVPPALTSALSNKEATVRLDLVDQGLGTFPPEILTLTNLKLLDLERNYLSSLPEEIGALGKMQQLFLLQNNLEQLPNALAQLADLRVLDVGQNKLTSFPDQIMSLKLLRALDLSGNQITTIPGRIKDLQALKILLLRSNQITHISDELFELKNLTTLDISGNPMDSTEFVRITKAMPNTKVITQSVTAATSGGGKEEVFTIVEVSASPVGGMGAFYEFVMGELKYPPDARRQGIEGRVFVEFVVNKDGSISDVRVAKGIGGGCDEEAARVVGMAAPWTPGTQKGKPVRQRMVLPITFKLGGRLKR